VVRHQGAALDFRVGGRRVSLTPSLVRKKVQDATPESVQALVVLIGDTEFPVKQAFALASDLDRADFTSHEAWRVFKRLGFRVSRRS
jgi:hypothetical protein